MSRPSAPLRETARGALRLRGWALALFRGETAPPPPEVGADAWRAFLTVERCAFALQARLGAAPLSAEGRAALSERAMRDLQRWMSAQASLKLIGSLAGERGWECVALKSCAGVADGAEPTDLVDVDVLVRPEHAVPLAALLEARGYAPPPRPDFPVGSPHVFELQGRMPASGVPVEVHYALAYVGAGVDPWRGVVATRMPGVSRLAPALHLWHLLVHATLHHPERRGSLRDLLQLRAALRDCAPGDLAGVEARIASHSHRPVLATALEAARSLDGGAPPADPHLRHAATGYLLWGVIERRRLGSTPARALAMASHGLVGGGYGVLWHGEHNSAWTPADYLGDRPVDRVPALGRLARFAWRAGQLAAATGPALALARAARRLAAEARP